MSVDPAQMPRRNPGLFRRVLDAIAGTEPDFVPQVAEEETTQTGVVSFDAQAVTVGDAFNLSHKRLDIYRDAKTMDQYSEEVSVALDTIADNVTTSEDGVQTSFIVTSKDQKVQEVLDATNRVTDLHTKVKPLVRNAVRNGDAFAEICVNKDMQLVDLKQLPAHSIRRNEDRYGNLVRGIPKYDSDGNCLNKPGECAFEQFDPVKPEKLIATFYPIQIVHVRMNWDGYSTYGNSHLRVTRYSWKKLRALEESMIVGRLTRDYLKLVFYIDTTGLPEPDAKRVVRDFKSSVTQRGRIDKRGESPLSVMTDFFMNNSYVRINGQVVENKSRIDTIDPKNEGLHQIADVEYHHRKMISTLRVPPAHMGFEKDVNAKSTLTQQDVQYVRWLRSIQQLIGQSLEQVYDTALALVQIDPDEAEYRIAWPKLKATDELAAAQAYHFRAQGNGIYLGASQQNSQPVIDAEWIIDNELDLTSDEKDELLKRIEQAKKEAQAQADAQTQKAHEQQLELTKTKFQANGTDANGQGPNPNKNGKGDDNIPEPAARKRPVTQEARFLYAGLVADNIERILEGDLRTLTRDQALSLEAARALTDRTLTVLAETGDADLPAAPGVVVHAHTHIDKGAIHHESHIDPGALVVEHQAGDVHVDATSKPTHEIHNHMPAQKAGDTHIEVKPAEAKVEVHTHMPPPRKVRAVKNEDGSITASEVDEKEK